MLAITDEGWRLPDDACALLTRLVAEHKPQLILECGSGRSTAALALAAAEYGGRVIALEHDPLYAAENRALVCLLDAAEVRYAPLEPHGQDLLAPQWYARSGWEDLQEIGMLMVDGPPGGSHRWARAPALPLLRDRLLPGCVIVLDDVNRDDEQTIMRDWGIEMTCVKHAKAWIGYGTL